MWREMPVNVRHGVAARLIQQVRIQPLRRGAGGRWFESNSAHPFNLKSD